MGVNAARLDLADRCMVCSAALPIRFAHAPPPCSMLFQAPVRTYVLGLGCRHACPTDALFQLAEQVLNEAGCTVADLNALATLDTKARVPAIHALAQRWRLPLITWTATQLAAQPGISRASSRAAAAVGTPSVAEAAALVTVAQAGTPPHLQVPRRHNAWATAALAYA